MEIAGAAPSAVPMLQKILGRTIIERRPQAIGRRSVMIFYPPKKRPLGRDEDGELKKFAAAR